MPLAPLRISVLDEAELVQHGLRHMLRAYADRVVVVDEPTGTADLVLSDPFDGRSEGAGCRPRGRRHLPWVVYTWDLRRRVPCDADTAAPAAYLSKGLSASEMVTDLEKVHDGGFVVDDVARHDQPTVSYLTLTARERQVLGVMAEGVGNAEIAMRLQISHNTLKTYIRSAYRKIGATSRAQAVLWAVDHALR